jgi:ATP-dependent exoDNAse (exonuclease V) alpha subunit
VALKEGPDCLRSDYATRAGLQQELDAIGFVNAGRNSCTSQCSKKFQTDQRLSSDQLNAVKTLLESTDRVCALRGIAGTGKTFTLQEVQRGINASGGTVIACAPTTSAAGVLRADGFANATTLADLLKNAESVHGGRLHGATFLVDEAGIASARQGSELCDLVRRHNARLAACTLGGAMPTVIVQYFLTRS